MPFSGSWHRDSSAIKQKLSRFGVSTDVGFVMHGAEIFICWGGGQILNLSLSLFACQGFFSCRNPEYCLEWWNQNFQPALALFSNAKISFHWHGGKTCLELYPAPVTFVYKKRESQFSVEECKHVWVGELQALSSNFCLCLHTTCFRQVWLLLIITIQARGANSPLLSYCLPFYFHTGIMLQRELQIKSLFLHEVLVVKRNKAGKPGVSTALFTWPCSLPYCI